MWNEEFLDLFKNLGVPPHMIQRAAIGLNDNWQPIYDLLNQRQIPEHGWNDAQIVQLLNILALMDSDKDPKAARIGEREGRTATPLLSSLAGGFCHGVGRSGELTAPQPKAAGASLMQNLTNSVVLSLLKRLGLPNIRAALVSPMGTGMSVGLAIKGALNFYGIDIHDRPVVVMTQIDHKSPQKGVSFIGGKIHTIAGIYGENFFAPEGVYVDVAEIDAYLKLNGDHVCAIVSTSAFFAPRVPDDVKAIAKLAKQYNVIHIVNNSYGLQSETLIKMLRGAIDAGRIDAIVQSTDKCFLTPVGGAVICSPTSEIVDHVSKTYAGRASASPALHLLVALLSMGYAGYTEKMKQQADNREYLESHMAQLAFKYSEHFIQSKNPVSCALSLSGFSADQIEALGGTLYNLRVTGPRIVQLHKGRFGTCTSSDQIPWSYVVMNAAIGVSHEDIAKAIERLEKAFGQIRKSK